jgi:hypothetical protein
MLRRKAEYFAECFVHAQKSMKDISFSKHNPIISINQLLFYIRYINVGKKRFLVKMVEALN